jgi:hypothetical protein
VLNAAKFISTVGDGVENTGVAVAADEFVEK